MPVAKPFSLPRRLPPMGAIPTEEYASYSVVNGFTESERILDGTIRYIRVTPIEPQPKEELVGQISAIKRQLVEMKRKIGRVERSWGDFVPKIVREYYEELNYEVTETDAQVDQRFKIDVIALKNNEVLAIQVKKGQIVPQEIVQIARKASAYLQSSHSSYQVKRVVIFASRLPEDYLEIREALKEEEGINLHYILPNHIVKRLPRYKYIFYE